MPAANDAQKPSATRSRCSRRRIANPPVTMIDERERRATPTSAPTRSRAASARPRPRTRKQSDEADVGRVEDVLAAPTDHVLRQQRGRRGRDEDPPAAQAPPVAVDVPGTRRTKATPLPVSSALAGHRITRCVRSAIADLEHGARAEREQDLRDREPEMEPTCPMHLQRRDRRREVEAGVAQLREDDRVRVPADLDGRIAHRARLGNAPPYEPGRSWRRRRERRRAGVRSSSPTPTASSWPRRRWTAPRPTRG